jgi:hypothetical protein
MHSSRGSCIGSGGALCGFEFWTGGLCFCLSMLCLRCVKPLPLTKGSETCLLQVILLFAFFFGFRSLVGGSYYSFLLFCLSWVTICVCCQCTHQGGDWGPCEVWGPVDGRFLVWWVTHCVDWFLAKYCRCRLRLDWCWCRWWTSAKGRCQWCLQVWRQVGFVRGTWWPAGSSVGCMVARTTIWSHGRFLGWASKPRSSRDYVGVESWVAIDGGYTEFAGFPVIHQKTTGFLGWSTKPRPKNRRWGYNSIGPVWPVVLIGLTVGTGLTREEHWSDRCAMTQSGDFEVEDTRQDRKACVEAKWVCGRWASARWSDDKDFRIRPQGACIPS